MTTVCELCELARLSHLAVYFTLKRKEIGAFNFLIEITAQMLTRRLFTSWDLVITIIQL